MKRIALVLLVALSASANDIREYRKQNEARILAELTEFLAIPNVASDEANIRRNAQHLLAMLERHGVAARLLESPSGGPPAVFGELRTPGATKTIAFYAHYDGQPVDPSEWKTDPWKPVVIDGRIYARSASDDKGPIVAMMAALDALRASKRSPSVNLKFFFEGEEEAGSEHLGALLGKHKETLAADGWIFCDGPRHQSGAMQVVFGVRGTVGVTLTATGPSRALHSGHYGNWAPNPIAILINALASMRDAEGNVKIAGFHDDVRAVTAAERAAANALPDNEEELRRSFAIAKPECGGQAILPVPEKGDRQDCLSSTLPSRLLAPSVNFTGIRGGTIGVNAIPAEASASIDFRLVPDQKPERIRAIVEEHLRKHGFTNVKLAWADGYAAARTPLDLPFSRSVLRIVEKTTGAKPLVVPTFGGSLPLYLFEQTLHTPFVIVPVVNSDNNQHAANENLRLQNLWEAIEIYAGLFSEL
ncbi:MAG TPA: M20/M25/M40 family metallo-hydrolase [Thermoanaerobaculia bacterium]|nr:M20/M25/M40 family metallo-hydrolase [Thermoanaerobaculia bacterium]